ncbi:MAG: hypothetical protein KAX39_03420 [candidate division Zixibacteria bacterium]|nr:hypothetical protein [candidate division Zixibacteria bacterium]
MMRFNSKVSGGPKPSLLKQLLFFSVILCLLVSFNLSFAEHPWDDVHDNDWGQSPADPPDTDEVLILQFGFDFSIIIHLQSAGQKDDFREGKAVGTVEKDRGHLLILIK